ncbi:GDP-L-fucose synthase [Brevibacillus choshinensis]|uniref:GDP-L-fucose synthase n=1 Tax=Brevibacillus choshinensis TaxID=54911 RepID=UPI002E238DD6|nr:GDP-L-fucose synthase [Brevibacillus choshinensis]
MELDARIFVAGHRGLVGSAIKRALESQGYQNVLEQTRSELDLLDQSAVAQFFAKERPEYVFLAAAKVGGISANATYPADFLYQNLVIQTNVIHAAYLYGVKKLLFLGSSCIYPKFAPQPIKEEYLLNGELEPTNEPYALAKIAGVKMCEAYYRQYGSDFLAVMPTNLYGPNDNFDLESSHVLPALLRKFHEAKTMDSSHVEVWGTGKPRREFLYVDDLADACVYLMKGYSRSDIGSFVNIGTGTDVEIGELATMIKQIVGFRGNIVFNSEKPDGTPRKWLDVTRIEGLGWRASTTLRKGIQKTYEWYLNQHQSIVRP